MPTDKDYGPTAEGVREQGADDCATGASRAPRHSTPDDVIRDWSVPVLDPGLRSGLSANAFAIGAAHLSRQREWSERTFGPGTREGGVIAHIRKELVEIERAGGTDDKLSEWVDVVILALDGAWRCGAGPQQILDAIQAKQARNETRVWPDWRTMSENEAIEHDRSHDRRPSKCGSSSHSEPLTAEPSPNPETEFRHG